MCWKPAGFDGHIAASLAMGLGCLQKNVSERHIAAGTVTSISELLEDGHVRDKHTFIRPSAGE